jgi:hypothetical protein
MVARRAIDDTCLAQGFSEIGDAGLPRSSDVPRQILNRRRNLPVLLAAPVLGVSLMARTSSVFAAALAGGMVGGSFVGVACWIVARGIQPPTIVVHVQSPRPSARPSSFAPLDEWTPLEQPNPKRVTPAITAARKKLAAAQTDRRPASEGIGNDPLTSALEPPAPAINNLQISSSNIALLAMQTPPEIHPNSAIAAPAGDYAEALSFALEAAAPFQKQGFVLREEYWAGTVPAGDRITIAHQLFKGNQYWFWVGTSAESGITIHVYDAAGKPVETESWSRLRTGAARVKPPRTGTYYTVLEVNPSVPGAKPLPSVDWALAYGFR